MLIHEMNVLYHKPSYPFVGRTKSMPMVYFMVNECAGNMKVAKDTMDNLHPWIFLAMFYNKRYMFMLDLLWIVNHEHIIHILLKKCLYLIYYEIHIHIHMYTLDSLIFSFQFLVILGNIVLIHRLAAIEILLTNL